MDKTVTTSVTAKHHIELTYSQDCNSSDLVEIVLSDGIANTARLVLPDGWRFFNRIVAKCLEATYGVIAINHTDDFEIPFDIDK